MSLIEGVSDDREDGQTLLTVHDLTHGRRSNRGGGVIAERVRTRDVAKQQRAK
jgi:hypothetical protein